MQRFLGGLEHELDIAAEARGDFVEHAADADQRRRVEIVTAGMHLARMDAGKRQTGLLIKPDTR